MKGRYSTVELATMLNISARAVQQRAKNENWPASYDKNRKMFIAKLLPDDVRPRIAAAVVKKPFTPASEGGKAGAAQGVKLARKKEVELEQARIAREKGLAAFRQLPEAKREAANARFEILQAWRAFLGAGGFANIKTGTAVFRRLHRSGELRLTAARQSLIGKSLSYSTLNRWKNGFERLGMMGLVPGHRNVRKGTNSLTREHQDFIIGILWDYPHSSNAGLMMALEGRFKDDLIPHESSVRRWVIKWKKENACLFLWRCNPDEWKNKYQLAVGDASEQIERLNQRWEFDSTPTDVMLVDGRHNLIGVIDVYSRRLKLLVSKTSRATAVAALTRRAIIDWGVPEEAKTDNGADYVSRHMVRVFATLDIEQILCPPFTPEAKPHIERAFRTFSHSIVEFLPGYVGHNVSDRKAIEARKSFADRLMKKGGEPINIKLTGEELQRICDDWCEAIYHQNSHGSLAGKTPMEMVRNWTAPVRKISDVRALDILLAEAPQDGGTRIIRKKGIQVDNIYYMADEIVAYVGQKVRVLLDATDLGTIYCFGEEGGFLFVAVNPERKGLDRAEQSARLRALQKQYTQAGMKELKKTAREQAVDHIHEEIMDYRKSKLAKISEFSQRSEEYSTPALEEAAKAFAASDAADREFEEIEEALTDEIIVREPKTPEPESAKKEPQQKVVPIFTSEIDRYRWIRDRQRSGGLNSNEMEFLNEFYTSSPGKMCLELEGDLRLEPAAAEG